MTSFSLNVLAQHKGFSRFNIKSPGGLKIDPSRKLGQQKLQETDIAESDFLMKLALLQIILTLNNI